MATKLGSESAAGVISELNKKFSGATLLSIYDLGVNLVASCGTVSTGDIAMSELASPIEFTVGVPEGSLATMNAAVGFLHAGAVDTINKGVVPDAQANAVSFPASKFSPYAVYGKMKSASLQRQQLWQPGQLGRREAIHHARLRRPCTHRQHHRGVYRPQKSRRVCQVDLSRQHRITSKAAH